MAQSYQVDGARVGQARQAVVKDGRPLKQVEAAELLGLHPVTLNRIENGKARVSLETLERIAALTGRTREWLLGEPETIDPLEAGRGRLANALAQISAGFEELNDVLAQQVRAAREAVEVPA